MFIDLTHRIDNETPVYPGDPKIEIHTADTIENSGYLGHSLTLGTHSGTHIDAPAHMLSAGKTLDAFTIDTFVGQVCYIELPDGKFSLEAVQNADIQAGDIVLFNSGMSTKFQAAEYFTAFPVMTEEIARYLVDKKVKMVGLDTCSADDQPNFPIHKILLGNNIPIIENLTNTEHLAGRTAKIYALPLKIDVDGAPARVIAEVN